MLWLGPEDHVPMIALQSSSVRSNLRVFEGQHINGGLVIKFVTLSPES